MNKFAGWYRALGFSGASSHSGRRTAITLWARRISTVGGSLRDVQLLAGHSALGTTQRYIEGSDEAKRRVVELVSGVDQVKDSHWSNKTDIGGER